MKKQCTNSSCRKFFTLPLKDGKCPHCGKDYARAGGFGKPESVTMQINGRTVPLTVPLRNYAAALKKHMPANRARLQFMRELLAAARHADCGKLTPGAVREIATIAISGAPFTAVETADDGVICKRFERRQLSGAWLHALRVPQPETALPGQAEASASQPTTVRVNDRLVSFDPALLPLRECTLLQPASTGSRLLRTIKALRELVDSALGVHMQLNVAKQLAEGIVFNETLPSFLRLDENGYLIEAGESLRLDERRLQLLEKESGPVLSLNRTDLPLGTVLQEARTNPVLRQKCHLQRRLEQVISDALSRVSRAYDVPRLESVCAKLAKDILRDGSFSRVICTDDSGRIVHATPARPYRLS